MKRFKLLFITTLILLSLAVTGIIHAEPVKLFYAKTKTYGYNRIYGYINDFRGCLKGFIEVENLAFNKQVAVVYQTSPSAPWQETEAVFVKSLANNKEVWQFTTPTVSSNADFKFAIRYRVNGQEYWDNNNNQDYAVSFGLDVKPFSEVVMGKSAVGMKLNWHHGWSGNYYIEIGLANLAFNKEVKVVYSKDNWVTTKIMTASYVSTLANGNEIWEASAALGGYGYTPTIEYAIVYKVNGVEIWDNNFGRNYTYPSAE